MEHSQDDHPNTTDTIAEEEDGEDEKKEDGEDEEKEDGEDEEKVKRDEGTECSRTTNGGTFQQPFTSPAVRALNA